MGAFPNVIFDLQNIPTVTDLFNEHLDRRNFGYLAGKLISNGFLVSALINIFEEFSPAPKPRKFTLF